MNTFILNKILLRIIRGLSAIVLLISRHFPILIPDKLYLKAEFYLYMGKKLNLKNPQTYNEKLQWLKLYNRKPIYTTMVDKYAAKQYVCERIGEQYIIPTYGVWEKFEDIDFNQLPKQFVLKTTHDSGSIVICKDKDKFDKKIAELILSKSLQSDFYLVSREWPYKNVPRRIIAEKYMEDDSTIIVNSKGQEVSKDEGLKDYKFFCFNGKVKAMFIGSDRFTEGEETKFDFYDEHFNHLPFRQGHLNAKPHPSKPENFELMKSLAEKISIGEPHERIDFYESNGKVYFGEITFFHFGGVVPFEPEEWDYKFGSWLELPPKTL